MPEPISPDAGAGQTPVRLDEVDRKILSLLQQDASLSLDQIADRVGASKTPVWNRIRKLREAGVIRRQVAILDPEALGLEACFFVLIRTSEHDRDWAARFLRALRERPEVRNARAYDRFYQSLIGEVKIHNVTALLSMEEIKATSALPIPDGER